MSEYVGKICPFCKTAIQEGEAVTVCPECDIPHHEGCWKENGGCTTFGCPQQHYEAPQAIAQPVAQSAPQADPANTCTNCGEVLGEGQAFCPKCGTPRAVQQKSFCSKCGTELKEGQGFCTTCGQKVGLALDAGVNAAISQFNAGLEQQKKKNKSLPFIIIGVIVAVVAALVIFLSGPSVEDITLSESSLELRVDEFAMVTYTIYPEKASDAEVKWESSNESVATVNSSGKITGKREGTCTITATAGKKRDVVSVTVIALTEEEALVVGQWEGVGFLDDEDDYVSLKSYDTSFSANDDFTGSMVIGTASHTFTWSFVKQSDDIYLYKAELDDGSSLSFAAMELDGEYSIVVMVGDYKVVFQK